MDRDVGTVALITALGYRSRECLKKCKCDELPCPLLTWLLSEIRASCPHVPGLFLRPLISNHDLVRTVEGAVLVGELRTVLKEMSFPQNALISEELSPIMLHRVTDYLVSELMAARMLTHRESRADSDGEKCESNAKEQRNLEHVLVSGEEEDEEISPFEEKETNQRDRNKEMAKLFQSLSLQSSSLMSEVIEEVETRLTSLPKGEMPEALLRTNLNSEQWKELDCINRALCRDYECRRQMLIKRFHVTLQSFAWGERGKERSSVLSSMAPFSPPLQSSVSIAMLLAAREDESRIRPVKAGPSTSVHKVLMGSVPDRGGRPGEIEPPMPSFTSRRDGGGTHYQQKKRKRQFSGKKKH